MKIKLQVVQVLLLHGKMLKNQSQFQCNKNEFIFNATWVSDS